MNRAPVGSSSPRKALVPAAAGLCGTDANHAWLANVRLVSKSASPPAAAVATARSARRSSIAWLARSAAPRWRCLADWKKRRGDGRRRCLIRARRARQRRSKKRLLRYSRASRGPIPSRAVKTTGEGKHYRALPYAAGEVFFVLFGGARGEECALAELALSEKVLNISYRYTLLALVNENSSILHIINRCRRTRSWQDLED